MKVAVAGGTGFIGWALCGEWAAAGHEVAVLTRRRDIAVPRGVRAVTWTAEPRFEDAATAGGGPVSRPPGDWWPEVDGADAVVNLNGEPIAGRRWNAGQKQRILQSRVRATRALVEAMAHARRPPRLLINGSAVGYYGPRGDEPATERDGSGSDFLSRVCVAWEGEARRAEDLGVRVVLLRTGLVLSGDGGALQPMLLPFRLFIGGPLGSGRQWVPWIHRADLVGLIRFLLERDDAGGPYNGTAPNPVTNGDFCRTIARLLGRPCWLPVPAPALGLVLGEMADALFLRGQRALPERALQAGFAFRYRELEPALRDILGGR
ncbi:MAG TPA: TIGR01777 family oxidoreductase [Bacillota bacterium]